jgi:hypothetical protein
VQGWLPLGWSPVFDGTPTLSGGSVSDYPEADVDADDNLTVECWYRIDADPSGLGAAVLVSKQDLLTTAGWSLIIGPASNVIGLYLHDGALLGGDTPLDAHYDVRLEYPPGQWHYIAAVFDRTNDVINFYTERGFLATVAAGSPGDCSNSEDFRIGFHGTLGNEHFGSIMRVALHKRVVSEQELMENCRKPIFLTVDNDTAGCWPLNEGSGSTAYDLSYLGKHLTLQGHTWAEGPQPTTPADVIPWLLGQKTVILPSEIDWDSIDELAILKPGAVDLLIRDETVEKTFDLILAPGGWYSWDADGLIRFGRLIGPEVNRVIQFNEAPSHVVIPDDDTLDFDPAAHTGLSIEMRIRRPSGLVADTILLSKFQALANTGNYLLFISGFGIPNQVVVFTITYDSGNRYTYRTSASAPTDEEFMLSISYNQLSGLCDIYFNGELQSQLTRLDNATTPDLTDDLLLGAADTSGTFPFPGWMNEVRLFRRSITEDEVLANLHTQLRGDEPDLVGYWRCDELDGDTLIDSSENGNDGTVTNVSRLTVQSIDNYFTRGVYLTLADNRDLALSDPLTEANAIYMLKSLNPLPVDVPALRQVVKYRHNWDHQRQEDLLALVNTIPTLSSLLKQEWRSVDGGGAESVRRNHLLPSPDEETESAIRELFYARIEAVRQAQLFSLERQRFEVVAPPIAQAVLVGDEIRIKSTRFGIGEKGRNFIVMRKKVLSNRMVELEVFG